MAHRRFRIRRWSNWLYESDSIHIGQGTDRAGERPLSGFEELTAVPKKQISRCARDDVGVDI
jgi:hypothetical protein